MMFSGSGEPTLHDGLGLMIRALKRLTKLPVVVFTNGSLLFKPELRQELRAADVVVSSLDVLVPGGYGS
jgi:wyosine [tRNA(Phe)-imidazoG37] synthetase (radical SAM superfamily)